MLEQCWGEERGDTAVVAGLSDLSHGVAHSGSGAAVSWLVPSRAPFASSARPVPGTKAKFLVSGDFWLGLEKIHHLVQEGRYNLLIELEDWEGNSQAVQFEFSLGGESTAYTLNLLGPLSGELENAIGDFRQLPFSTRDRDHDLKADTNCAKHLSGQCGLFLPRDGCFPFHPRWWAGAGCSLWC